MAAILVACGGADAIIETTAPTTTTEPTTTTSTTTTDAPTTTTTQAPTTTTEPMSTMAAHPHQWGTTDGHFTMEQEQEYCDWLRVEKEEAYRSSLGAGAFGNDQRAEEARLLGLALGRELGDHSEVCV